MELYRPSKVVCSYSSSSMLNLESLPEELVIEILSHLPVKSLVRFRCVSKSWCKLIKSPMFINDHLRQTGKNGSMLLMSRDLNTPPKHDHVLSLSLHDLNSVKQVDPNLYISFPDPDKYKDHREGYVSVLGPCNGVVCLANKYNDVILCNPSLREFKHLPSGCFTIPSGCIDCTTRGVGFGIDSYTNDFKVVFIRTANDWALRPTLAMVHLYSSSTNSWRLIDNKGAVGRPPGGHPYNTIFFNGACHWDATPIDDYSKKVILSFDMSNEVFKQLEYPEDCVMTYKTSRNLSVANECLNLVIFEFELRGTCEIEVWEMKKYGVKSSWIKRFAITREMYMCPFSWKNNECLFGGNHLGQLACFEMGTNQSKKFPYYRMLTTLVYEESLISLNQVIKMS